MAEMKTMKPKKRFSVGYALLQKKQRSFIQCSLLNSAKARGIDLVRIDTDTPLVNQGPFDCVIHKLTSEDWKQQLTDYLVRNPSSVVIDSPDAITRLHNRISMLEVVSQIEEFICDSESQAASVGIPKQIVIHQQDNLNEDLTCWTGGLKYPVIAKPLVADGSVKSHKMLLIFSKEGLEKLKPPTVLQEFVNHGGVIFKVYVVGEYVKCVRRKSLADISEERLRLGSLQGSVSFCQVSNMKSSVKNCDSYYKSLEDDAEMPPMGLIRNVARGLRKAMKLHLFNFDVIRDTRVGNRYLVVDINYFPGYAKMPGYESVLTDFLWDVLTNEEARSFSNQKDKKEAVKVVDSVVGLVDEKGALPVLAVGMEEQDLLRV